MKQLFRKKFNWLFTLAIALLVVVPFAAFADVATNQSIHIDGTEATNTYTNSLSVSIDVSVLHCPPGGDLQALEVDFSNDSASGPWTAVHVAGTAWPGADADGCNAGVAAPASFNWNLASGADGSRTVYARFKHGPDEVFADDSIILDTTAPVITDNGPTVGPDGANGWYISAVTNQFSANDGTGSGLADSSKANFSVSSGSDEGGAVLINSGPVSDVAGNTNPGIDSASFMIDLSDPSLAITSPADGSSTSNTSVSVSGTASDTPSGIASVTLNGSPSSYDGGAGTFSGSVSLACGLNTIEAVATDYAGRTASTSISVTRTCNNYTVSFSQPLDPSTSAGSVTNKAKNGRVIPVKVEIFQGSTELDTTNVPSTPTIKVTGTSCNASALQDPLETYADAGSSNAGTNAFRWSSDAPGFWIYNLDTKALGLVTGKCYRVDVYIGSTLVSSSSTQWAVLEMVK